jgi:hypothetical protein
MDVKGDGNCGYYALLLALQNVGIMEYFIDTKSMSRKARKVRWQRLVVALRQRLKEGSEEILSTVITQQGTGILGDRAWYIQRQGSNRIVEFIRDPRKS